MLILGLLLLACTAAFVGLAIADNLGGGADHNVTVLGHHIATMNGLAIFCAGLALALIFGLGLMMALGGAAMRRRRGRRLRRARKDVDAVARERDELAARLDAIHAEHVRGGEGAQGAAVDDRTLAADREGAFRANQEADLADERHMATAGGGSTVDGRPADTAADAGEAPKHRHTRHLFGH
ncbi:hypothetical protein VSR01_27145 [Actinacidiphila sp. DG2A-62]|uniref:hypothetical protein n=1 Tax=Actinacidiphila sp. DG2A-62 TaxID=3108821 RepID=UPI002DBA5375|nr:hypothetical protein [Actinacidiphila sp. DG2A-62]MEC3996986.1 hypothetical protein [Actinacidiphila sp. DG2A-62]